MSFRGHFWTLAPNLRHRILPRQAPDAADWSTEFRSEHGGNSIRLSGLWREEADADTALLVVHGLGGSVDRQYCVNIARAAARRGWSCLRIALRGADRRGTDFYHAGLVEDLEAAWRHDCLKPYAKVHVAGFSLGGHVSLRFAALGRRERLGCVAAMCPPLDLNRCAVDLDEHASRFYRRHILNGLMEIYAAVAARAEVPTPVERMRRVDSIREFDALSIVPRYGYRDVDDYYRSESVWGRLQQIESPAVVVASRQDPMVPIDHLEEARRNHPGNIRWLLSDRGGHVGFPPRMSFAQPGPLGWPDQLCSLMDSML